MFLITTSPFGTSRQSQGIWRVYSVFGRASEDAAYSCGAQLSNIGKDDPGDGSGLTTFNPKVSINIKAISSF